ncbi:hypothetical protein KW792_00990 [Candidatus Saccharibacteria bacterium]|nr:hypothetical protein [Candidatus Saccharibacteria bacterium]
MLDSKAEDTDMKSIFYHHEDGYKVLDIYRVTSEDGVESVDYVTSCDYLDEEMVLSGLIRYAVDLKIIPSNPRQPPLQ